MIDAEVAQPFIEQFKTAIDNAELNGKSVVLIRLEVAQTVIDWINTLEKGIETSNHNRNVTFALLQESYAKTNQTPPA